MLIEKNIFSVLYKIGLQHEKNTPDCQFHTCRIYKNESQTLSLKNNVNIWKLTVKIIGNIDPGLKDLNIIIYMVFLLRIPKDSYVSIVLFSQYLSRIIISDDFLITNYK